MFQRTRELEDKLEAQRRHLKELEEKVGGWSSGRSLELFSGNLFSCLLVMPQVPPLSPAPPRPPIVCPIPPNRHIQKSSDCFKHLSREDVQSGINSVRGVWGDVFYFHKRPSPNPLPPPHWERWGDPLFLSDKPATDIGSLAGTQAPSVTSVRQRPVVCSQRSRPSQKEVRLACHTLALAPFVSTTVITISWVRKPNPRKIRILARDPTAGKGQLGSPGMSPRHLLHTVGPGGQMNPAQDHVGGISVMALTTSCTSAWWPWIPLRAGSSQGEGCNPAWGVGGGQRTPAGGQVIPGCITWGTRRRHL